MTDPGPGGRGLGVVAHLGLLVADLDAAMATLAAAGVRWSTVTDPVAVLQFPDGTVERTPVRYVAASGGEPRVKLIEGGGYFTPGAPGVHHLSYWVEDLESATADLVAAGYVVEATGLSDDGEPAYRYLLAPGLVRVELGLTSDRARFDAWAG